MSRQLEEGTMTDRVRRFPVSEEFELEFPKETLGPGDTVELLREKPSDFFTAHIVRGDGTVVPIDLAVAEMLFRNGALG